MAVMEKFYEDMVLSYIIRHGRSSRKEIADFLGVTNATLSHISASMLAKKVIYEDGEVENGKVGRKHILLEINADYRYAMGFDVTNTAINVSISNLRGTIVKKKSIGYLRLEQVHLNRAITWLNKTLLDYEKSVILGIGLLAQGYIENEQCCGLPIKDIKEQIKNKTSIEPILMNNIRGLALSEIFFGNTCRNFLLIKYGPGLGGAIVINGEILNGRNNQAGEIGHIVWDKDSETLCPICGKRGCLESIISYDRVIKNAAPETRHEKPSVELVIQTGKKDNYSALNGAFDILAKAVSYFAVFYDPEKIYLAGELFANDFIYDVFIDRLEQHFQINHYPIFHRIEEYGKKRERAAGAIVLSHHLPLLKEHD
jgi:predicted NBD/HSP70 family sugar kinase